MIRVVRINVHLVDVLAGMPNYGQFLKELVSNKHKLDQISLAFLSDESLAIIQNKVLPKRETLEVSLFHVPSAKPSLATPWQILALASILCRILCKNMLVEVGKLTFPVHFVIIEMEEDSKVPLSLGRHFLHTVDAVIRVKQKQLNLGVGSERMVFSIDSTMKHSYSNDDTCFSIDVIDEILEEDFDALLDKESKILYSIEETALEDKIFAEFDEFIAMNIKENTEPKINEDEIIFEKITFDTDD
ncbi:reverse transcriptase domain-containing protein [Tanacetum coccineum]